MAKKLTTAESNLSRPVLHDIFIAGKLLSRPVRTVGNNFIITRGFTDDAETICNEIKFRKFNFSTVDAAINNIALYCSFDDLHGDPLGGIRRHGVKAGQIANIIAAFCAEHEIYWDDVNTLRTSTEVETYRKSLLGGACWNFGCFLSQQADKKSSRKTTRTSRSATGKTAPMSGYKSSGPKSGIIKGLLGEPGEKVKLSSTENMYTLKCKSTKTKEQFVFIDPLRTVASPNVIRFGDPSGYSACKLFFNDIDDAHTAIEKIVEGSFKIPVDITGIEIKKQKVDLNGYFLVATEIGPAYIKASKLNEAIKEALEESTTDTVKKHTSRFPEIKDIDVYSEAMFRYE